MIEIYSGLIRLHANSTGLRLWARKRWKRRGYKIPELFLEVVQGS